MTVKAQTESTPNQQALLASRWKNIGQTMLFLLFFGLIFMYRLDQYPAPWHDEAQYLHVAKNYAENGVYADYSSEGNRYTGPIISLGPTVLLPVALLYKVFGVSILAARLVISAYALLTLIALYRLAALFGGQRFAWLTLGVTVFNFGLNLPYYARNVMGEVPALGFTFAALWLWLRSNKCHSVSLILVGLLFGMACVTKNQYAIFICPSLVLAWVLDLASYRRRGSWQFILPGIITGAVYLLWTVYILYGHDASVRDVSADLDVLRSAQSGSFFLMDVKRFAENLSYLADTTTYGGFFLVIVLYGLYLSLKRDETGQRWGLLTSFLLVSLVVFVTSAGWKRFAVPSLALAAPLFARLVLDLTGGLRLDWRTLLNDIRQPSLSAAQLGSWIGVVMLLSATVLPLGREAYHLVKPTDDTPYRVADYVNEHIPKDALIESWEEELAILTDHTIHYPPQIVETYANFYERPTSQYYDFRDYVDPDYVIVGQFGHWTGLYSPEQLAGYTLIHSIGAYDIYQRTND